MTVIWINGTFGAGKTTTAGHLVDLLDGADPDGVDIRPWRHEHVNRYLAARPWLTTTADLVIDTTNPADDVANQIRDYLPKSISNVG